MRGLSCGALRKQSGLKSGSMDWPPVASGRLHARLRRCPPGSPTLTETMSAAVSIVLFSSSPI
jgi:hypothetical protein